MVRTWVKQLIAYGVAGAVVTGVAMLGSSANKSTTRSAWYQCVRPVITPPNVVFPIAWSILYALLAVALGNALLLTPTRATYMLWLGFAVNLGLNVAWSFLYFGKKNIRAALAVIVLLWLSIVWIVVGAFTLHPQKWKGYILLPYLFWVTFATVLNGLSLAKERECAEFA